MTYDRHRLSRQLNRAEKGEQTSEQKNRLAGAIAASIKTAQQRAQNLPELSYPSALPISARAGELIEAIKDNQILVVAGETGSGKSTQLPKLCLAAGQGIHGQIAHTQPRRIAARSIAQRLAQEMRCELGQGVGYRVRFAQKSSADDYITVLTDGLLLSQANHDRYLNQYDTIIIDEAHERSLNIDLLLGYLKRLLARRADLKLLITSATIDTQRFSQFFGGAKIITVSGRSYPVELIYQPLDNDKERSDKDTNLGILRAIEGLYKKRLGSVLVFLPGEREIREAMHFLGKHIKQGVDILPLYSRLPASEQAKLFKVASRARIILSTNVAETSLTLPGIDYVVDTGYARISRYHASRRINALPIERISQAAANQRMGRCGRLKNGVCVRLYSEQDFADAAAFTLPEIKRTSLAGVVLTLLARDLGDISEFPFIDAPDRGQINGAKQELQCLGAIDQQGTITAMGKDLAAMPVDPRIGRILWAAGHEQNCLAAMVVLAATLEIGDPRLNPFEKLESSRAHHREFSAGASSDFIALLRLWEVYQEQKSARARKDLQRWCERNYLSPARLRDWTDLAQRLGKEMQQLGPKHPLGNISVLTINEEAIHKSLLSGFIDQVGMSGDKGEYQGAFTKQFSLFPGSVVHKAAPKWVLGAELVETGRLYARMLAPIKSQWIEELAPHLLRREYSDPEWSARAGQVMAHERAYLMNLPIYSGRRIPYAKINLTEARALFIRDALVANELQPAPAFLIHNQAVIDSVRKIERKLRRHDVLASEQLLAGFYDEQLPAQICSQPGLNKWLKSASQGQRDALLMDKQQIMQRELSDVQLRFPDTLNLHNNEIELDYRFQPGHEGDGITAKIPVPLLNQLSRADFDRLVPGYLAHKLDVMIRSLPKSVRRVCAPIADTVALVQSAVEQDLRPIEQALAAALQQHLGVKVRATDFDLSALENNLKVNLAVVDASGDTLEASDNLEQLQQRLGHKATKQVARLEHPLVQSGKTEWVFGRLPKQLEHRQDQVKTTVFPALVDNVQSVGVQLFDLHEAAERSHLDGLVRLFLLSHPTGIKLERRPLPHWHSISLRYAAIGQSAQLRQEMLEALLLEAFAPIAMQIRDAPEFERHANQLASALGDDLEHHCALLNRVLIDVGKTQSAFKAVREKLHPQSAEDIEVQLEYLLYDGFVSEAGFEKLSWYPKILAGLLVRIERCQFDEQGDLAKLAALGPYWDRYLNNWQTHRDSKPLEDYRWLVELYRLSLFAQKIALPAKISAKRLEQAWHQFSSSALQ